MASCSYCGREVSPNAKTCPGCGEEDPGSGSAFLGYLIFGILGIAIVGKIVGAIVDWVTEYKTEIILFLTTFVTICLGAYAFWRKKKTYIPSDSNHENERIEPNFELGSSETVLLNEKAQGSSDNTRVIEVPYAGENVPGVTISEWLVSVGDRVEKEEILVVIETDKASMELVAPMSGVVDVIHYAEGTQVAIGVIICELR